MLSTCSVCQRLCSSERFNINSKLSYLWEQTEGAQALVCGTVIVCTFNVTSFRTSAVSQTDDDDDDI